MLFSSTPAPHISLRIVLESKHLRMGERKRKPLRSRQLPDITEPKSKSVKTYDNAANVAGPTKNSRIKKDMTILEKVISDDERDEWEEIELRQSNSIKTEKGGESESDSDHDDDRDDADEIRLEGSIEHITEKYTFEFNDMREEYTEGICVLLRSLIQNPTKAYELAKTITLQSMSLLICISTKNFVCVHSSFYQSIGVASKYSIYVILYVLNFRESFYARSPTRFNGYLSYQISTFDKVLSVLSWPVKVVQIRLPSQQSCLSPNKRYTLILNLTIPFSCLSILST